MWKEYIFNSIERQIDKHWNQAAAYHMWKDVKADPIETFSIHII